MRIEKLVIVISLPKVAPNKLPLLDGSKLIKTLGSSRMSSKLLPLGNLLKHELHGLTPLTLRLRINRASSTTFFCFALEYSSQLMPFVVGGAIWASPGI